MSCSFFGKGALCLVKATQSPGEIQFKGRLGSEWETQPLLSPRRQPGKYFWAPSESRGNSTAGIVQWGASGGRPGWKEAGEAAAVPTLFPPSGTPRRDGAARTAGIRMAPSPGQESLASLQRLRAEPRVRAAQRSARARPRALPGTPPGTAGRGGGDASGNGGGGSPAAPGDAVGRRGGADSARRPRRGSPGSYFRLEAPGFQRRRTPAPAGRLALSDGDAAVRVGKEVCAEAGNLPGRRRLPARPRAAPRPRLLGACAGGSPGSPGGTPSGRGLADKPSVWFITRVTGLVTCVLLLASLRGEETGSPNYPVTCFQSNRRQSCEVNAGLS